MAFKILSEAVEDKLASLEPLLNSIERGGGSADLSDLGRHLIDAMALFQRNPGIEAAADDLYAAAAAIIRDNAVKSQPMARKMRLLHEAHMRLRKRLVDASDRIGPYEHLVVDVFPIRHAA